MESAIPQSDRMQDPAGTVLFGKPNPLPGRLLAIFVCGASSVAWLWFSSPKPNYLLNPVVPLLVLFIGGVVVPLLVFFIGAVAGLFMLKVPGLTAPAMTRRRNAHSRHGKYYTFGVLFTAVAMISIMFHAPLRARFALSRSAMNAFVADVQQNPVALRPATMRVGSYVLETAPQARRDGALMFHLQGDNEAGFTYSATPIAGYPGVNAGAGRSLGGGWYWFSDD